MPLIPTTLLARKNALRRSSPDTALREAGGVRLHVSGPQGIERSLDFVDENAADAIRQASAQGWQVRAIETLSTPASSARANATFPLLLFSQQLLALLEAGLALTESLRTLVLKEREPNAKRILQSMLDALGEGISFSAVLEASPQYFPEVYVATVRAAERTGDLPQALARFIVYQRQFDEIRKKLVSSAIYPAMLLVVGGFVTFFLLGYVVPRFSVVYESAGREIPWMSSILLVFGKLIHEHWPLVLAVATALLTVGTVVFRVPGMRARLLDRILSLPWLAERSEEFRLARFYRALSLLLASGIALPRAMGMVGGLLSVSQQICLKASRQLVEEGQPLSAALCSNQLATPVADSLIRVGERSGQMSSMLERAARFHDDDFAHWIDWVSRLLEPLLMVAIGLVIGTVVVLLYVPIFDLAGSLQ